MAVNVTALQDALATLFAAPPETAAECGQAWADAMALYAATVVPPSTAVPAASSALSSALGAAFGGPNAGTGFDAAFAAFALAVGAGMLPAYAATPPGAPGVADMLSATIDTHGAAAAAWAEWLDGWFRTGSSALVAPPHTEVPWT